MKTSMMGKGRKRPQSLWSCVLPQGASSSEVRRLTKAGRDIGLEDSMKTRHILLGIVLAVGLTEGLVQSWTPGPSVSAPPPSEPTLAQVRRATERFRNVK